MPQGTQGSGTRRKTGTARLASKREYRARQASPLLSVAHAAAYVDTSRDTIYRLIRNGELRPTIVGARIKVAQSDLDDYINRAAAS